MTLHPILDKGQVVEYIEQNNLLGASFYSLRIFLEMSCNVAIEYNLLRILLKLYLL